jgi:hypothetical protein
MPLCHTHECDNTNSIPGLTSLTVTDFVALMPLVNTVFLAHMAEWPLEGKSRTPRRYRHTRIVHCLHREIGCCLC